ncbi:MAG: serine hydrolase [Ignavibacteriae bacterium]|nr:serine hydrolase [Ignavibacteriota bacterium]
MSRIVIVIGLVMGMSLQSMNAQEPAAVLKEIQRLEQQYGGHLGVMAKNLRTGEVIRYNAEERFPTASLIKYPVMAAYFKAVAEGRVKPDMSITLTADDKRQGSGVLEGLDTGAVITLRDAVRLMIILSDNTATNLVVDRLGTTHEERLAYVNDMMKSVGLKNTRLLNRLYSWKTKQRTPEGIRYGIGVSTPEDMVTLSEALYRRTLVSPGASDDMLSILKAQFYDDMVPRFLPASSCASFAVAHKTGFVQETKTDAGLVLSDKLDMAIAIFIDKHPDHGEGINNTGILLAGYVARAIWNHFTGMTGYDNGPVATSHVDWNMMPGGKWGIWRSTAAPFPHPDRANGLTKKDGTHYPAYPHYMDSSIVVFVPEGLKPGPDGVNLIIHFHGHGNDNMNVLERYMLPQALGDEKINAILVLPQGPYRARDSFCGKMEDQGGLRRMVEDVLRTMQREEVIPEARVAKIVLSAHSGGYRPVAFCLEKGEMSASITHLFLFDAFYGNFEFYKAWLEKGTGMIETAYTEHLAREHTDFGDSLAAPLRARFHAVPTEVEHDAVLGAFIHPWLSRLPVEFKITPTH